MTRVLIVNADDLGYDPEVTRGILEAMRDGIVSSATLMVNGPHSQQAAEAAREISSSSGSDRPTLALGLHLNLARWRPCTDGIPSGLLDAHGEFIEANAGRLPSELVARETLAQLSRLQVLTGAPATHVDVHKHLHRHPNVLEGVCAAVTSPEARRAHGGRILPVRSTDAAMRQTLRARGVPTNDHFIGDAGEEAFWTEERLRAHLADLEDGVTELMCHPGYVPTTVRSGYAHQRETELRTLTSQKARDWLHASGARLADFRAL